MNIFQLSWMTGGGDHTGIQIMDVWTQNMMFISYFEEISCRSYFACPNSFKIFKSIENSTPQPLKKAKNYSIVAYLICARYYICIFFSMKISRKHASFLVNSTGLLRNAWTLKGQFITPFNSDVLIIPKSASGANLLEVVNPFSNFQADGWPNNCMFKLMADLIIKVGPYCYSVLAVNLGLWHVFSVVSSFHGITGMWIQLLSFCCCYSGYISHGTIFWYETDYCLCHL